MVRDSLCRRQKGHLEFARRHWFPLFLFVTAKKKKKKLKESPLYASGSPPQPLQRCSPKVPSMLHPSVTCSRKSSWICPRWEAITQSPELPCRFSGTVKTVLRWCLIPRLSEVTFLPLLCWGLMRSGVLSAPSL